MQVAKPDRILVFLGGLAGAAGVALSAAAAHTGGGNMATAASFLLMHAPALLALSLLAASRLSRYGAFLIALGLILFCGDLLARQFLGDRLFPYAAPSGGMMMIGGWLVVAISAFFPGATTSAD
jgi:uncharacterized membrane protein YgdD (TMEM256/DUF423 family)